MPELSIDKIREYSFRETEWLTDAFIQMPISARFQFTKWLRKDIMPFILIR